MVLDAFMEHNPWSRLVESETGKCIESPWNDSTLILNLSAIDQPVVERLNNAILFQSFSAVYHRAEQKMELIFTPFRHPDLSGRAFSFDFEGKTYKCYYGAPSETVFDLARASQPVAPPSTTNYRNLRQFRGYLAHISSAKKGADPENLYSPVSFWVEPCVADEQSLARMLEHLNFFMAYFDHSSPMALIHEAEPSDAMNAKRIRYLWGEFPESIRATPIDPYLLGLWSSARAANDTFRQFIYYYQMLEYASFYFLTEKSERSIEVILKAPESAAFPSRAWQRIQNVLAGEKIEDGAKLLAVARQSVDLESIWKEVEANRIVFETTLNFDGGYSLPSVIAPSTDLASFRTSGFEKLVNNFRQLRNALVHAREKRMANVISASRRNHALVRPYISPLSSVAMQVAQASPN